MIAIVRVAARRSYRSSSRVRGMNIFRVKDRLLSRFAIILSNDQKSVGGAGDAEKDHSEPEPFHCYSPRHRSSRASAANVVRRRSTTLNAGLGDSSPTTCWAAVHRRSSPRILLSSHRPAKPKEPVTNAPKPTDTAIVAHQGGGDCRLLTTFCVSLALIINFP